MDGGLIYQQEGFTGFYDKNQVPIFIGDLVKMFHFTAAKRRKVYIYKKVMRLKSFVATTEAVALVHISQLGLEKNNGFIYKHWLSPEDCPNLEVIEGEDYTSLYDGSFTCYWERKKDFRLVLEKHGK
jgi:hypothetical protein